MNPKNALFLSATLTTFVLAILAGVVTKVNSAPATDTVTVQATAIPATAIIEIPPTDLPTDMPAPTLEATPVDPILAANLAAQEINQQDVYSVESTTVSGVDAYKVVFSSGDIVYVGLDGTIISKDKLKPVVVNVAAPVATKAPKRRNDNGAQTSNNGGGSNSSSGGGESEREHEGGDD